MAGHRIVYTVLILALAALVLAVAALLPSGEETEIPEPLEGLFPAPGDAVVRQTAIEIDPGNPTLLTELADTISALGDIQSAISLFLQAVELAPNDPTYWRLLAGFSIEKDVQVRDIGLPAARQAHLLDTQDPAALDLIGRAYLNLQNPLVAERFFTQALEVDAQFAPAYLHLGMLYIGEGKLAQARNQLDQVLILAPDTKTGDQALQLLEIYIP